MSCWYNAGMTKKTSPKSPTTLEQAFSQVDAELLAMFIKKHKDYGKGNILSNKELGIAMRVSEKVERLKNLLITQQGPMNESIEETWIDIAVYGVIAVMYKRGWFQELDLEEEKK